MILDNNVRSITGETFEAPKHGDESFLKEVIAPIYDVLRKVMSAYLPCMYLTVLLLLAGMLLP